MAMRQPIKTTASAMRAKVIVKAHVGDGLEAILQNNPQLRRLVVQAKDRGVGDLRPAQCGAAAGLPARADGGGHPAARRPGHHGAARRARWRHRGRAGRCRARGGKRAGRRRGRRRRGRHAAPRGGAWAHRRSGADVPARDGHDRAALARGRDRDRQAHRGRSQHRSRGPVREPAHHARGDRLARRDPRRPRALARHHRPGGDQRRRTGRRGRRGDRAVLRRPWHSRPRRRPWS